MGNKALVLLCTRVILKVIHRFSGKRCPLADTIHDVLHKEEVAALVKHLSGKKAPAPIWDEQGKQAGAAVELCRTKSVSHESYEAAPRNHHATAAPSALCGSSTRWCPLPDAIGRSGLNNSETQFSL
ncbi:MAG: hypothetical protein MN733_20135, partial [Nitrososphaera sp.]|nr:hypothetical protein [Nitrososphaera sp.]